MQARGTFEVKLETLPSSVGEQSVPIRRSLDKVFAGELAGTGKGEMLAAGTAVKGSAAYVALELVSGTLAGRSGSFVLQHVGVMTRGTPSLQVAVVPDSGTGELVGLAGTMAIIIADGRHSYEFEYTLDTAP